MADDKCPVPGGEPLRFATVDVIQGRWHWLLPTGEPVLSVWMAANSSAARPLTQYLTVDGPAVTRIVPPAKTNLPGDTTFALGDFGSGSVVAKTRNGRIASGMGSQAAATITTAIQVRTPLWAVSMSTNRR